MSIEQLVTFAREGELDEFKKLLYRQQDLLEQTLESGESPLIAALYNGKMEIVEYLLEKGIGVNIHEAAALGDENTVAFLLDHEPRLISEHSFDGWTPLHLAAFFGAYEVAELLLARGAEVSAVSNNHLHNLPIHAAAAAKRSAIVLLLLQKGSPVNAQQSNGYTLLHQAVENYDLNMVQMLLDFGSDPNLIGPGDLTPLALAEIKGYVEMKRMMTRKLAASSGRQLGRVVYHHDFYMPELNDFRTIRIYLPAGYEEQTDFRYPVLYMHDGQNLFDRETSSYGMSWDVAETLDRLSEQGEGSGFIVVGIDNNQNGLGRYHEYSPWTSEVVKKYLPRAENAEKVGGDGFAYLEFIVHTLKPFIERHYRTQLEKSATMIGGSSMGGFISLAAAFTYPEVFGRVLSCSTAVFFEEQALFEMIRNAETTESGADQRIYMDIGTNETSNSMMPEFPELYVSSNRRLYELLLQKGFVEGDTLKYVIEEGAEHNELAWARRLPDALRWLFR